VLTGNADDSLDTDFGYQGFVQFLIAVRRAAGSDGDDPDGETIFEIDSSANPTATPRQELKVANFTLVQNTPNEPVMRIRGGADVQLYNGVVVAKATGAATGCLDVDNNETVTATRPLLRQVMFDCQTVVHPDSDTLETQALGVTGNTANTNFVNSLLFLSGSSAGLIANGTQENAVAAATLPAGFQQVSYIGALSGPADAWTRNWTCNSDVANLGGQTSCLDIRVF
jgi:hypothetical protein